MWNECRKTKEVVSTIKVFIANNAEQVAQQISFFFYSYGTDCAVCPTQPEGMVPVRGRDFQTSPFSLTEIKMIGNNVFVLKWDRGGDKNI